MNLEKEFCDIYDVNKSPTGRTVDRAAIALNDDEYFLIVSAVLVSVDKKILITKRDMQKQWSPGMWEIPGGGVKAGESSLEAIYREILEETNIDLFGRDYKILQTQKRRTVEGNKYFADIYCFEITQDDIKNIKGQEGEVSDYRLASIEDIKETAKDNKFLRYEDLKDFLCKCIS
nr:NUDIX hydrolase [uncultured Lachnoanaerobaculum sp.]